mmetsp:Transcript_29483/g.83160  ORF Transcript_29483/g.83160 Transcript_29483/m.83160 type:complete len:174 (+) Transcript_29483:219-740(+)|eukprot:CAMPEP_0117682758 /NCGR_PEP_ID=MMETSP0804-20121206/19898_1 /TAXON_ID=1074897 /ORGANISM="Tetraselmis astigmatica, Strain CCMP880" /LENGTH=173 /DNA_ID=CAMNT_0005493027 /DNA_START=155 /DNA_END=676 /DNA_ORIENTATION=+
MATLGDTERGMQLPPSTYQHHYSLESLSGVFGTNLRDGTVVDVLKADNTSKRHAGNFGMYTNPVATSYRSGGVTVKAFPGEPDRHCNLSDDYRGDYGGKNELWFGTKGPTFTFAQESQVAMGAHRLSDTYAQRAQTPPVDPAMYRPWTSHSRDTHKDPKKVGEYWRAQSAKKR